MRAALALLLLSACVAPTAESDSYDCNCVEATSDESSIADTGFPVDLIYMQDSYAAPDSKGLTHLAVQYDATKATPEMVAASPAALCKAAELTLVSSRIEPPGPDDMDIEGSKIVRAICK